MNDAEAVLKFVSNLGRQQALCEVSQNDSIALKRILIALKAGQLDIGDVDIGQDGAVSVVAGRTAAERKAAGKVAVSDATGEGIKAVKTETA